MSPFFSCPSYQSIRDSSITQDKSLPFTTAWGRPERVLEEEVHKIKKKLAENQFEVLKVIGRSL